MRLSADTRKESQYVFFSPIRLAAQSLFCEFVRTGQRRPSKLHLRLINPAKHGGMQWEGIRPSSDVRQGNIDGSYKVLSTDIPPAPYQYLGVDRAEIRGRTHYYFWGPS